MTAIEPCHADDAVIVYHADCLDVMRQMDDHSVDAVVCDPPYALEFMGREWDTFRPKQPARSFPNGAARMRAFQTWCEQWAGEALRVLRPGGYMLACGGTRTWHRLCCALEDAGFEIRDTIAWIYANGFPKGRNIARDIEDATGDADLASQWAGWSTSLKPAYEPIVVARSPLSGTVAVNTLAHGTGGLNINACRVEVPDIEQYRANAAGDRGHSANRTRVMDFRLGAGSASDLGRWPTNLVFSHAPECAEDGPCAAGCPVAALDRQSGVRSSGVFAPHHVDRGKTAGIYGEMSGRVLSAPTYGDSGGASRFFPAFRYQQKATAAERPRLPDGTEHLTVKPLDLVRWLVRLVCRPGGTVLDMFAGSGTTGEACLIEGMRCILIDNDQESIELIKVRLSKPIAPTLGV